MTNLDTVALTLKATLVMLDDIPANTPHEGYLENIYGKIEECIDMANGILGATEKPGGGA